MKSLNLFRCFRIVLYIGLAIALFFLSLSDNTNFGECYIYENIGILCPSCGITRGVKSLLSFDFVAALNYNKFYVLVLLPLFLILMVDDIISIIRKKRSFVEVILDVGK